jgi:hypothetical protein
VKPFMPTELLSRVARIVAERRRVA